MDATTLRNAGFRVTTARLAALRLAPEVLRNHGRLSPRALHTAARSQGYVISTATFYRVLPTLANAGLLQLSARPPLSVPSEAAGRPLSLF